MTQTSTSDHHLSRATVIAAVIGAVGVIAAALIGHRAGQERSSTSLETMERQLNQSSATIAELRNALNIETRKVADLTKQLERACGNEVATENASTPTSQVEHEFRYDLKGCTLSGSKVTCELLIRNLGAERRLEIKRDLTRLLSDAGDEYVATRLKLGADVSAFIADATIPANSSMSAQLLFDSVRPNTTAFQWLRVGGETGGRGIRTQRTSVTFPSVLAR